MLSVRVLYMIWIFEAARMEAIFHVSAHVKNLLQMTRLGCILVLWELSERLALRSTGQRRMMKTASFCCNESQQLSLFQFPFSANAFSESRAPKYKKAETIKVSPDSVLFIHISWKRARRFGILFAIAWEKHPRHAERFGKRACTPFIYSRQQVAHEIRLIRSNGRGAASVVLFPLCMSRWRASAHFEHQLWRARAG